MISIIHQVLQDLLQKTEKVPRCPKLGFEWKLRLERIIEAVNASTLITLVYRGIF